MPAAEPWFEAKDWPLAGDEWPGTFPKECVSTSGMRWVIDLAKPGEERCLQTTRIRTLDGPETVLCMMPPGHDTPHLPMTPSLNDLVGPMIVRAVGHG